MGYKDVEIAGYFGRTAAQVRDAMRKAGLNAPSAHVPLATLGKSWEQTLADAHIVGHQYLVMPWLDEEDRGSLDSYRRIEPGDIALIRTGWGRYFGIDNAR